MRLCKTCGKPEHPHRMRHPFVPKLEEIFDEPATAEVAETNADWTVQIATRVSERAERALDERVAKEMGASRSSYLRKLIYRDLGLIKES